MRKTLLENENWTLQKDDEYKVIVVSYFEDGHFCDELIIPYNILDALQENAEMKIYNFADKATLTEKDAKQMTQAIESFKKGKNNLKADLPF